METVLDDKRGYRRANDDLTAANFRFSQGEAQQRSITMQSVIATFDDTKTAQAAVDSLIAQGFSRESVHLQAAPARTSKTAAGGLSPGMHRGFLAGIENFFSTLFESTDNTEYGKYAEAVRRGSTVVVVDVKNDAEVEKANSLMDKLGLVDVDERATTWKAKGWKGFDPDADFVEEDDDAKFARQSVPVVQEELQVGKRAINVGGLRVIKRMSETPVSEIVKLREERATIERRPVDRDATEADFENFKEGTIEVREMSEQAVVGKTARVVEEVVVGKEASERSEKVSDTVRRTEVNVERVPGENAKPTTRSDQK
jgi:uncharacterized protein (TIGR02271 family)